MKKTSDAWLRLEVQQRKGKLQNKQGPQTRALTTELNR